MARVFAHCAMGCRIYSSQLLSSNQKESHRITKFYLKCLKEVKEKHQVDASIAGSVFYLVLLRYHGLYAEHPATLP